MRGLARFTHESVRLWFRRLRDAFPKPEEKRRRTIAVEESKLKLNGEQFYAWAAVDLKTGEVLACRVFWVRSMLHAESFLRKVLETCTDKPLILVGKGPCI